MMLYFVCQFLYKGFSKFLTKSHLFCFRYQQFYFHVPSNNCPIEAQALSLCKQQYYWNIRQTELQLSKSAKV